MSDIERSKEAARTFFDQVWSRGQVDRVGDFLADDFISHNTLKVSITSPADYAAGVVAYRLSFPDLVSTVHDVLAEGDRVAVRGTDRGTHRGPFMGREPTGRTVEIGWIEIFRMEDGKAAEGWVEADFGDLLAQLDADISNPPGDPAAPAGGDPAAS